MPTPPGGTPRHPADDPAGFPPLGIAPAPALHPVHEAVADRPHDVAEVVVELGRSILDEHDLLELLQRVVDVAARTIAGVDSAGVTAHLHGRPFTAVHTDRTTLEVDVHQYEADEGPCLQAMRTGEVVRVDVATSRLLWPEFTADAEAAGIRSFLAAPLGAEHRLGALNLYSRSPDGFGTPDAAFLAVLTAHATRAIEDYARLSAADLLAVQLREALASRAPIEQAKGILMAVHGIDDGAAFERLRTESQHRNVRLHEVAVEFVRAHTTR
ncbi:GAF and ANTAR domain-containing protein [Rhodococcus antarcticus]|uniref:GAF and ANTAR domain-containing protein n=1 Tax=Rhodococcus antarcticus TaxID=2987751 RepID=A0ABY6NZ59_9NOCA|nr:GAF and ANTAR domain-containing protein [Rhodococcus antarcticus]UZJ24646.1 GAF and ANTAR domain-containing protein [Rhodococcus antarcticus]